MNYLEHVGKYFIMLKQVFKRPQKGRIFYESLIREIEELGLKSLGIIMFISFFIGGVIALQTALNLDSPFIPKSLIGFAAKRSIILEFAPTFCSIILAGKVGSNMAAELGGMRQKEQIDALEIMGVNTASYLIMPKITAALFVIPLLVILAAFLGIIGGYVAATGTGYITGGQYQAGLLSFYEPYFVFMMIVKSIVFAFILTSVSCYQGYYVSGGSIELGKASTSAVVLSDILILCADYVVAMLLT